MKENPYANHAPPGFTQPPPTTLSRIRRVSVMDPFFFPPPQWHSATSGPARSFRKNRRPGCVGMKVEGSQRSGP